MIDFSIPPELEAVQKRAIAFMDEFVYLNESRLIEDKGLPADLERELQQKIKAMGLWAPHLPREWGGMGIGFIGQALVNEIAGRSVIAPRLFGNAAPDAGNSELLLIAATPEQKEKYLRPLAAG
ncbi:MAG TPA: acyl-CoA dehydrogenase family protein, partial [Pyrinomonadaceae bacterium]